MFYEKIPDTTMLTVYNQGKADTTMLTVYNQGKADTTMLTVYNQGKDLDWQLHISIAKGYG